MCILYEGTKSLIDYLKEKLCGHFDELLKDNLQICLYRRPYEKSGENGKKYKWECLYNEDDSRTELETVLPEYSEGKELAENVREIAGKHLIWVKDCKNITDSRLESSGSLSCLTWMFFMTKECEAADMFLKVSLSEIIEKINDILLLENMLSILGKDAEGAGAENVKNYFFSSIMDKENIVNRYCKELLKVNQLPDWIICIQLSAMLYETRSVKTRIYFYKDDLLDENIPVKLFEPIEINRNNCRTVRKLMEMAGEGHGLVVTGTEKLMQIRGIIRDNPNDKSTINIEFAEHMVWRIKKGDTAIFEYRKGECSIPPLEQVSDKDKQIENLEVWLKEHTAELPETSVIDLVKLITEKNAHGAAIVFMEKEILEKEVTRLQSLGKAYRVTPCNCENAREEFTGFTAIDGAIMADLQGTCIAVGAILDGWSVIQGNPGRGARYNSVSNYIHVVKKKYECEDIFAVIFSEDKMINVKFLGDDQEILKSE